MSSHSFPLLPLINNISIAFNYVTWNVLNKIITPADCIVPSNAASRMWCQPQLTESQARKHD